LAQLTAELDSANEARDEFAAKVKSLEQENLAKEQEITSLGHQKSHLEAEIEKLEVQVKEHKEKASQHSTHTDQIEALTRKTHLHEEEAEETERQLKETYEKYADPLGSDSPTLT
jgi:tropomyosin